MMKYLTMEYFLYFLVAFLPISILLAHLSVVWQRWDHKRKQRKAGLYDGVPVGPPT